MVWARTKLSIWDYIFEPVKEITMSFVTKDPEKFYKKVNSLMRSSFNVPEGYVQEKDFEWQKLEDGNVFSVRWEVNKILDKFSYLSLEITLKGKSKGGKGKVSVRLAPKLVTEYPQDTLWQQSIFYEMLRRFWHTFFYHKKRMEYIDLGKELVIKLEQELKKFAEELNR